MKINKVTLYAHDLTRMDNFYCMKLGFKRLERSSTSLEIQIGDSILAFELAHPEEQKQYHFAFNTPSNLFYEAKEWIRQYSPLLTDNGQDEVYFESINAHSLYFYDPEENVVEFIARSINPEVQAVEFTAETILSIGEINLTTDNILNIGGELILRGIPVRGNERLVESSLNFMGESEDDAYLLLGPAKRNWYFSTKEAVVSRVKIDVNNQHQLIIDENGMFHVHRILK